MTTTLAPAQKAPLSGKSARFVGVMTLEKYQALEQNDPGNERYEFADGKVYRVAGASPEHNRISRNVSRELENFCEQENLICESFVSDQKVFIESNKYLYPDVCLVCGEAQFDFIDALRNPCGIFEVLSPSPPNEDHISKFREYQKIESLRHYILIEQNYVSVLHYEKLATGLWAIVENYTDIDKTLRIAVEGAEILLPLSRIYYRVEFPTLETEPAS